jgi:short-subunit dehydrogenase
MRSLTGKRVLITGGASGIGRSMARRFAAEGAHLILVDLDSAALEIAAAELAAGGTPVEQHRLDITDNDAILAVRDAVHAAGGPIDVLVNNAGTVFGGYFLDVPIDHHLTTFRVNLEGLVQMTHAFLPELIHRPDAHLVNIASLASYGGAPGGAAYGASKWGVLGFSESIELELARLGLTHVHVTTVCPGVVSTGLFEGTTPLRLTRTLTPDQVADAAVLGVLRNSTYVRTPWLVKLAPVLRGVLPHRAFNAVHAMLGGTSAMDQWTGRAGGPNAADPASSPASSPAASPGAPPGAG